MADAHSEEEIAARLGDLKALGKQFDSEAEKTATGNRAIVAIGLVLVDIIVAMLFALLFTWGIVMGVAAVAFAAMSFALAVLAAVGTANFCLYARQLLRSYFRWHRNTLAAAGGGALLPNIPAHPQISAAKNRSMRKIALIALTVFVITFQAGYIIATLVAGALEFWHVWGWF